ncbi:unnamed protein product [Chrysoparadoxa australica]
MQNCSAGVFICLGYVLLLINCVQAFVAGGGSLQLCSRGGWGMGGPVARRGRAGGAGLQMQFNDFRENTIGVVIGDTVRVKAEGVKFYHMKAFPPEGLDATGMEGTVKDIKLFSKKTGKEISANRPVMVVFTEPKFIAHFEFDELEKV